MTLSIMSAIKAILYYSRAEATATILVYYAQKYRRDAAELRSSESITLNVKN